MFFSKITSARYKSVITINFLFQRIGVFVGGGRTYQRLC